MMKRAVISTLCIVLAVGLTYGGPLFYDRQKILNKVEFSDAGIDGGRIDPLIDVSDEEEGNITLSSFTDTNDVGGNDSKEEDSLDRATVDVEVDTQSTPRTNAPSEDSDETTDNVRKANGTASTTPVTLGTTKLSEVVPQGDNEGVTVRVSAPTTTAGGLTNSTKQSEITRSGQSTGVDVTSEKAVHTSAMPMTHGDATALETSTLSSSSEEGLERTTKMIVNSATTTASEAQENHTASLIATSEGTTTSQSEIDSLTTSSMGSSEGTIVPSQQTEYNNIIITEPTNPTEPSPSVSNEQSSVEVTEITTFMPTDEQKETAPSTSSLETITNLIDTTTQPTTDDGDHITIVSFQSFPVTDATTPEAESSTLLESTVLTTDSFREFSETTVLPTTSEFTTSPSTSTLAIGNEEPVETSLGPSNPTTVVTETTSTEIVTTTANSVERSTATELQVSETSPQETTNGDVVTTTPTTVSSIESSEVIEPSVKDVKATTITENVPAEIGATSEATVSVTQTLEVMSTIGDVEHSSESGEFVMITTTENVLTTNAAIEELTSTVTATTRLESGDDLESVTTLATSSPEVPTVTPSAETTYSTKRTSSIEEEIVSIIPSTVINIHGTVITTTEKFAQDTTTAVVDQTEETTTSVAIENGSTTADAIMTEKSTEEATTSKSAETETATTEEVIWETTTIAVVNTKEIVSDVAQSTTTSEMLLVPSTTVETPSEATEAVSITSQEMFTETTTPVSQSGEKTTSEEFKEDGYTTAEPSTTAVFIESSTRKMQKDVSSTANIVTTTVSTAEQISTLGTDSGNTGETHRSDTDEYASTTTEQIATFTSTLVVANTEKTIDLTTQDTSTAAIDTTATVFFSEALAATTAKDPEQFEIQNKTSVLDLVAVTTSTPEETTTAETTEGLTVKPVLMTTEKDPEQLTTTVPDLVAVSTRSPEETTTEETTEEPTIRPVLMTTEKDPEQLTTSVPDLGTGTTRSPAETTTKETTEELTTKRTFGLTEHPEGERNYVSVTTVPPSSSMMATTTLAIEELDEVTEGSSYPETNESTITSASPSNTLTGGSSPVSVETTDPTTTMLASTTSRNYIEEVEKGSQDETIPQHTESTLLLKINTEESTYFFVETTDPTTTMPATTSRNIMEEIEKVSGDETKHRHIEPTSPLENTTTESLASTTTRNNVEELDKDPQDEASPEPTEFLSPSEIATQESSTVSVKTKDRAPTMPVTTSRDNDEEPEKDSEGNQNEISPESTKSTLSSEITTKESPRILVETTNPITSMADTTSRNNIEENKKDSESVTSPQPIESTSSAEMTKSSRDLIETATDATTETDSTTRTPTRSFTTSTPNTPLAVSSSEVPLFAVTKKNAVTSTTTQLTEVNPVRNVSLTSEGLLTTTVVPATSSERPSHRDVSESVGRSTKNIPLQNPTKQSDLADTTIPPEKELPSTSDALSTPAEDNGSTAHTIQPFLVLVPIVLAQLRSVGAFSGFMFISL